MNKTILNPINQCSFTGLEKPLKNGLYNCGLHNVIVYCDNFGKRRIILKYIGKPVAAILLNSDSVIEYKYTHPNYRGNNYTRQLALLALTQWKIRCLASPYQTTAGAACYK